MRQNLCRVVPASERGEVLSAQEHSQWELARNLLVQWLVKSKKSEVHSTAIESTLLRNQSNCWQILAQGVIALGLVSLTACGSDPSVTPDPQDAGAGADAGDSTDASSGSSGDYPPVADSGAGSAVDSAVDGATGSGSIEPGDSAVTEPPGADGGASEPPMMEAGAATADGGMSGAATDSGAMNSGADAAQQPPGPDAAVAPTTDAGPATDAGTEPTPGDAGTGPSPTPSECAPPAGTDYAAAVYASPQGCFLNSFNLELDVLVTSEQEFAEQYACTAGVTSGIDFTQQQLFIGLARERTSAELGYVHIDDAGDISVGLVSPAYCGGAAPPNTPVPVLMARSLRAPVSGLCTVGQCTGLPLP